MLESRKIPMLTEVLAGKEPDQHLNRALLQSKAVGQFSFDDGVFSSLYRENTVVTRLLAVDDKGRNRLTRSLRGRSFSSLDEIAVTLDHLYVLQKAVTYCSSQDTLTTRAYLRALVESCIEDSIHSRERPMTLDLLLDLWGASPSSSLKDAPNLKRFFEVIRQTTLDDKDIQYILAVRNDRLVFRPISILDDYVQSGGDGLRVQRALLTHFKDQYGGFSEDEIAELEDLLNSAKASEREFQTFFEEHPHFFRKWDYREVHAHVYLSHSEYHSLIPDFILTDRELQKAAVLEIKLPGPTLVRRQHNRDRFASSVQEARTQLLRYRDWFREARNRTQLIDAVGMQIYEPHLAVIIGRSSAFNDSFDRQRLAADNPEVEVVTYDDMLNYARRRRLIIDPASDQQ